MIGSEPYDYADAFEIRLRESDARTAEEFARCALEQAPRPVRWAIRFAHRHVLRLRLGPRSSPDHILGWKILTAEPEVLHLGAVSPLLGRAVLVGHRVDPSHAAIATYLFYKRPTRARALWTVIGPMHRRIAPYLLDRAAAAQTSPSTRPLST
jgi:hypothetical protein